MREQLALARRVGVRGRVPAREVEEHRPRHPVEMRGLHLASESISLRVLHGPHVG